jgi:hypothetical protein
MKLCPNCNLTNAIPFGVKNPVLASGKNLVGAALAALALAPSLDALLEQVMRLELLLIQSGLNLPIGGSLLLIATKK